MLHQWWTEGEAKAVSVFRARMATTVAVVGGCAFLYVFVGYRHPVLVALFVLIITRAIAERRRAVIITPDSVIFRPPFGKPSRIHFDDMETVAKTTAPSPFFFYPHLMKGVEIRLRTGERLRFPLDFPRRGEILEILEKQTLFRAGVVPHESPEEPN